MKVFLGSTTFEREITLDANLSMLEKAARALGAPNIARKLANADLFGVDEGLKKSVLNTAKRFGKARFAQLAAEHIPEAGAGLPPYVRQAVEWLLE